MSDHNEYTAGWNAPGYLPDSDPGEFDTFDDAKRYIIEELKRQEDEAGEDDEELAEDFAALAEDVNLESEPFSVMGPDGYAYWVACE